jgi:hypothetical protein
MSKPPIFHVDLGFTTLSGPSAASVIFGVPATAGIFACYANALALEPGLGLAQRALVGAKGGLVSGTLLLGLNAVYVHYAEKRPTGSSSPPHLRNLFMGDPEKRKRALVYTVGSLALCTAMSAGFYALQPFVSRPGIPRPVQGAVAGIGLTAAMFVAMVGLSVLDRGIKRD